MRKNTFARLRRKDRETLSIDSDKATEEDWNAYKVRLEKEVAKIKDDCVNIDIDEIWERILNCIKRTAGETLPRKKRAPELQELQVEDENMRILKKDIRRIAKWCSKIKKFKFQETEDSELDLFILKEGAKGLLEDLRSKHSEAHMEGETVLHQDLEGIKKDLEVWWKLLFKTWQTEKKKIEEKLIQENIERKYAMVISDQKRMINSLLERPYRKLRIDRVVIETDDGEEDLIHEPQEVLKTVKSHFESQFRKRNVHVNNLPDFWKNEYEPIKEIEEDWYKELLKTVEVEEWDIALSQTKNNLAPGITGISYPLLKNIGELAKTLFVNFSTECIKSGKIPKKWKLGLLYPIPKQEEWGYKLNKVRPILLLETFRKTVVRIVNNRLSKVLKERDILKGRNFAGLPEEGTAAPVHLLNCILEDAKEKKKELWLFFQDMKKAFDSVSLEMLDLALRRIKIPEITRSFIIELYKKREMEVLTSCGVTEKFEAQDGIDQGEVISPLVWRIFYDPLLTAIRKKEKLGYKLQVDWPIDLSLNKVERLSMKIEVIAYADDTTYVANSRKELESIIEIAEQFYKINDIEINSQKSELVVINKDKKEKNYVELRQKKEKVVMKKADKATRFLGVWISSKAEKRAALNLVRREVDSVVKSLRKKKVSLAHMVYMNNRVLLPRIEYRMQHHILPRDLCDRVQSPMFKLTKNKANMASTLANAVLTHKNIVGFKSIW